MPDVLVNILTLASGFVMLIIGGELLVRGAISMAARLGVSPLIIGLTVVAFGTSAPELSFNLTAALHHNVELTFGNVVGSNIANIGLILGLAALMQPLKVNASVIRRELPMMLGATAGVIALTILPMGGAGGWGSGGGVSRLDGGILLGGFVAFLVYSLVIARRQRAGDAREAGFEADVEQISERDRARPIWIALVLFAGGLAMLVGGGQLSESGAVAIARHLGVSDQIVGLTIVAIATSLPELVISLVAVRRGQVDIAVGNVVGSNLFNILLVFGASAMVHPIALPTGGLLSMGAMALLAVLLWPMCRTYGRVVSRLEGLTLLVLYVAYLGYEVWMAFPGASAPAAGAGQP